MLTIILKSDGNRVQSHIKGKSSSKEIMPITDAFAVQ